MHTAQLRSAYFVLIISLLFVPLHAFVVPWISASSNTFEKSNTQQESSTRLKNVLPQLTWLRDSTIERIFGFSAKEPISPSKNEPQQPSLGLPNKLLAKYGGDVVLRFNLTTMEEERALAEAANTLFLDVWEFTNNWADIRLREDDVPSLLGLLPKSLQNAHSNLMPDLAKTIYNSYPYLTFHDRNVASNTKEQSRAFTADLKARDGVDNVFFKDYQPLSVIVPWMRLMASMFTTHVRLITIGTSFEGRDIIALRVGVSPSVPEESAKPRRTIIVTGGSHAREWISISTVTYIAWSIITSYGKSPGITKLLQEFDFVFIPTINPDGYVYTWENDRLWRKNRQQTNLRFCRGLDIDRGFGYEWDGNTAQTNPCSENYPGEKAFQAVESHRLAKWAKNETDNNGVKFVGFLDFHSYSQQVLYPYSYSCSHDPPSLENLEELGLGLAKAIRISSGELYGVASACEGAVLARKTHANIVTRMETGAGSAIDWFYHELHVRYSYQIKLRDTGSYGFLLPSENIVPTGEEAYNAIKYFGDFLLGNKGIETAELTSQAMSAMKSKAGRIQETERKEDATDGEANWELGRRRK